MKIRLVNLYLIMAIHYLIDCDEAASRRKNVEPMKRKRRIWTNQEEADLIFFDVLTDSGEFNHSARIKSMWNKEYPNSNLTDSQLFGKLYKLRMESREDEAKKQFKWNEELEQELWYIYHNTRPYKKNATIGLEEEWKRRHPDHQAKESTLIRRVRDLSNKPEFSGCGAQELPKTDFEWDKHYDSDLFHAHNVALGRNKSHWRNVHLMWSELYPQYSYITPEQLKERVEHLNENLRTINFPWTREQNQELLEIYDETLPDMENQGQRIYDIWTKIHPQYKFMTPYYLQVHASSLDHERNIVSGGNVNEEWTDRDRAELVDMHHRHRGNRREFHEEWVRNHPRQAYMAAKTLTHYARKYAIERGDPKRREMEEGLQPETPRIRRQKYEKYTPEEKQEILSLYYRTDPQRRGHTERIEREMNEKQRDENSITGDAVKKLVKMWKGEIPRKKFGKAPMCDPSYEAGPSSASRMSEDSK